MLLSNIDECLEQVFKSTSIEGRTILKHIVGERQTRWSTYNNQQKQLKYALHNARIDRVETDAALDELEQWLEEYRIKLDELTNNLSLRDENRKRLHQIKCLDNDRAVKQTLFNTLKQRTTENERFEMIEQGLELFQNDLRVRKKSSKYHYGFYGNHFLVEIKSIGRIYSCSNVD
jgi:hypothetical protein